MIEVMNHHFRRHDSKRAWRPGTMFQPVYVTATSCDTEVHGTRPWEPMLQPPSRATTNSANKTNPNSVLAPNSAHGFYAMSRTISYNKYLCGRTKVPV